MSDVKEQLRAIETVEPPDLWTEIGSRRPGPERRDTRTRLVAAMVALVVALSGVGVATWAFIGRGKPVPAVSPTSRPSGPTASSPAPPRVSGLALDWTASVGGQANGVAVANGIAYVKTDKGVVAVDARTGAELWRRTLFGSVATAPAVSGDLVIAVDDGAVLQSGAGETVWALEAGTGSVRWSKTIGRALWSRAVGGDRGELSAPVVDGGLVFFESNLGPLAIDLTTGRIVWEAHFAVTMVSTPTVSDGRVYVGADQFSNSDLSQPSNRLYAFDEQSGREIWTAQLDGTAGRPVVADGTVFVSTSYEFWLSAFDEATGGLQWRVGGGTSAEAFSDPAVADGVVYAGHGSTASGNPVWGYQISTGLHVWSGQSGQLGFAFQTPAIANGVVYASAAADGDAIYAFQAYTGGPFTTSTGELLDVVFVAVRSGAPGAGISPPIVADGHVFVTAGEDLDAFRIIAS
jgi:outer membrane protein assembly factor BamB